jgi:hypothetical protein
MTKNANKRATGCEPTFLWTRKKNDSERSKNSSSRPPYANDMLHAHYGTLAISFIKIDRIEQSNGVKWTRSSEMQRTLSTTG